MSENEQPRFRRQRPSLVCENCKRRKVKCDKLEPCTQCIKAKLKDSCSYTARAIPTTKVPDPSVANVSRSQNPILFMENKLKLTKKRSSDSSEPTVTISLEEFNALKNRIYQIESTLNQLGQEGFPQTANQQLKVPFEFQVPSTAGFQRFPPPVGAPDMQFQNEFAVPTNIYKVQKVNHHFQQLPQLLVRNSFHNQLYHPIEYPPQARVIPPNSHGSSDSNYSSSVYPLEYSLGSISNHLQGIPTNISHNSSDFNANAPAVNGIQLQQHKLMNQGNASDLPKTNFYERTNSDLGQTRTDSSVAPSETLSSYPSIITPGSLATTSSGKSPTAPEGFRTYIGIHPYSGEDDTISFYEGYSGIHIKDDTRAINFGPFAWASIMKRDQGLCLLWDSVSKKSKGKVDLFYSNVTTASANAHPSHSLARDSAFEKLTREVEVESNADTVPYKSIAPSNTNVLPKQDSLKLGLTFYDGKLDRELKLIEKIRLILPRRRVIRLLLKRYFGWVYLFAPFIDHDSFISEISRIIGPQSDSEELVQELNVEKRLDLAQLGLLLIMLRLAYLSLFKNKSSINEYNLTTTDPSAEAQELKYLLSNPVSINIIDIARECFEQFQFLKRISFPVLQLAFYIKLYNVYAPEEGDVADTEPQSLNGVVLQMAYQVGLNREPDNLPNILNDPKQNNLRRKLWSYIMLWDLYYGCTLGNPMMVNENSFDTKLPYHVPGNENIPDLELDKNVTEFFAGCAVVPDSLLRALLQVLDVRERSKMSILCANLNEFEERLHEEFPSLGELIAPVETSDGKSNFAINLRAKYYVFIKAFLMSIYFYFYLHYERTDIDLAFFYLKKIMLIGCTDVMPHYYTLFEGPGVSCDMILNPSLQNIINKFNQLVFSLIIRINFKIHQMKNYAGPPTGAYDGNFTVYYNSLCKLSSYLTRCAEISIAAISKLSNRYYYAWRLTKGHRFLLKTITSVEFYQEIEANNDSLCVPQFTLDQVKQFSSICELALNNSESGLDNGQFAVDERSKQYYGLFSNTNNVIETSPDDVYVEDSQSRRNTTVQFLESEKIDNLWLQMLSKKYDKQNYGDNAEVYKNTSNANVATTPGWQEGNVFNDIDMERFGFDLEQSTKFDIFSDLPFDQIFNSNAN